MKNKIYYLFYLLLMEECAVKTLSQINDPFLSSFSKHCKLLQCSIIIDKTQVYKTFKRHQKSIRMFRLTSNVDKQGRKISIIVSSKRETFEEGGREREGKKERER